jgi:hypothetical protein
MRALLKHPGANISGGYVGRDGRHRAGLVRAVRWRSRRRQTLGAAINGLRASRSSDEAEEEEEKRYP